MPGHKAIIKNANIWKLHCRGKAPKWVTLKCVLYKVLSIDQFLLKFWRIMYQNWNLVIETYFLQSQTLLYFYTQCKIFTKLANKPPTAAFARPSGVFCVRTDKRTNYLVCPSVRTFFSPTSQCLISTLNKHIFGIPTSWWA